MLELTSTNDPVCYTTGLVPSPGSQFIADGLHPDIPHVMQGVPSWLAMCGVILIIFTSHYYVSARNSTDTLRRSWRFNLLKFGFLNRLVKKQWFPLFLQSFSVMIFILILSAGLFGSPKHNIGPVLTWTWWWALLIFLVLGFGKAFCAICPWEALSSLVTSLSLKSRMKKLGYEQPWPKWAKNIFPAILFFILLTWFELGNNVTHSPSMTATLGLVMAGTAILSAIIFERRAFCRYACLVGRVTGLYALFSPVELRPESKEVCTTCTSKACFRGTNEQTGCPTLLFPGNLKENTYCTLCTECIRACPHDNIGINLRPPASDLFNKIRFQWDEATLAIVLLALTSFHGLTMTPLWGTLNDQLRLATGLGPVFSFTILMLLMLMAPILLFWAGASFAKALTQDASVGAGKIFKAFAYSVIPVALFYHLAHNSMHFFLEAPSIIPLLSDPFGFGWNLFGTAGAHYGPLLTLETLWGIQVVLIVIGHVYGVLIADRVARTLFRDPRRILRSLVPLLLTMVLFSAYSIWLIAQPMEMRSGM